MAEPVRGPPRPARAWLVVQLLGVAAELVVPELPLRAAEGLVAEGVPRPPPRGQVALGGLSLIHI